MTASAQANSTSTLIAGSVALARLIAEVRGPEPLAVRANYNRTHNRHNR